MKVIGVIPARYGSSRFPGKPLADICGKPMIWWVYQQAKEATKLNELYVATDNSKIESVCKKLNIPVVMTSEHNPTAANRIWEVSQTINGDFYVAINGDEPLISSQNIDLVIPEEKDIDKFDGTNIICEVRNPTELEDRSNIKVVFNKKMEALYMSRSPIPFPYKAIDFSYYKHVGIIGYKKEMLDFYQSTMPGELEKIEGIDTLRFIDYGKKLLFIKTKEYRSLSVDTPMDLEKVRKIISNRL